MFYRQRGQVSIRNQICRSITNSEHALENRPVILGRLDDLNARLIQPTLDSLDCLLESQGPVLQSRVRSDANECGQDWPAQTDWRRSAKLSIPPFPCGVVMLGQAVFCVEQEVCINQDQR